MQKPTKQGKIYHPVNPSFEYWPIVISVRFIEEASVTAETKAGTLKLRFTLKLTEGNPINAVSSKLVSAVREELEKTFAKTIEEGKFKLSGSTAGDMFFTEQMRAMEEGIEKLAKQKTDRFDPQNILLHDRFAYVFISDAMQKAKDGDRHYQGLRFVPIFHNPGRDKQGVYANPFDYYRVVATKSSAPASAPVIPACVRFKITV